MRRESREWGEQGCHELCDAGRDPTFGTLRKNPMPEEDGSSLGAGPSQEHCFSKLRGKNVDFLSDDHKHYSPDDNISMMHPACEPSYNSLCFNRVLMLCIIFLLLLFLPYCLCYFSICGNRHKRMNDVCEISHCNSKYLKNVTCQ